MEKSNIFDNTKYFIIDMDGTFYLGGNIIPGAPDFITLSLIHISEPTRRS